MAKGLIILAASIGGVQSLKDKTIKKARATFPPGGDTHKEFLNTLQREGAINCRMAFFMKQLIENPDLEYKVDEKGTLRI